MDMRRKSLPTASRPERRQKPSATFITRGNTGTTRFNRRFNTRRKSLERWHEILARLNSFEGVINSYDGATPDEVKTLKAIHRKLYECRKLAEKGLKEAENLAQILR
ncbi:MAG: hypothetical protein IJP89_02565 [Synergistaceae bacterium]|nr:hypothetical protein [Synergistaceae bacterium]